MTSGFCKRPGWAWRSERVRLIRIRGLKAGLLTSAVLKTTWSHCFAKDLAHRRLATHSGAKFRTQLLSHKREPQNKSQRLVQSNTLREGRTCGGLHAAVTSGPAGLDSEPPGEKGDRCRASEQPPQSGAGAWRPQLALGALQALSPTFCRSDRDVKAR